MLSEKFLTQVDTVCTRLEKKIAGFTHYEKVMGHQVKLGEEAGELAEQILIYVWGHLKDKGESVKTHIGEEMADVIITTAIMAKELDIDLNAALENKLNEIVTR